MKRVRRNRKHVDVSTLKPIELDLMLDSGAFGAWTRGQSIDVQDYIKFVKEYGHLFTSVVNLDVIPGEFGKTKTASEVERSAELSYENLQAMKAAGLAPIPVYHQGEDLRHLLRLVEDGEPYIGISPSGDSIAMNTSWFDRTFSAITNAQGQPLVKTHGFGVTATTVLQKYPWFSADSVTWVIKSGYGCIFVPQFLNGKFDYSKSPISVWVTGSPRKNDRYEMQEQGPIFQALLEKFTLEEVGATMAEMRYDPYVRMQAMAKYYSEFAKHLPYSLYGRAASLFSETISGNVPTWEMKKVIFAVGPTGNIRRSHILNELDIRPRLLSYFDLRDTPHEEILRYVKYGVVRPMGQRKLRPHWHRAEYWNRRKIVLDRHYVEPSETTTSD